MNSINLNHPSYVIMASSKKPLILAFLLWSAMGPYIFPELGLRVEHFIMYGLLSLFALKTRFEIFFPKDRNILMLYALFIMLFLITILVTVSSNYHPSFRKVIADSENYIQPIALIALTFHCIKNLQANELLSVLEMIIRTIIIILSLNALLAASSIYFGTWMIDFFNVGGEYEGGYRSVAAGAATQGRFSGIFNQPFEAGVAYGSCLLLIVLLQILRVNTIHIRTSRRFLNLGLLFVFLGGFLSVSKVFFPLAIFVVLLFLYLNKNRFIKMLFSKRAVINLVLFYVPAFVFVVYIFDNWSGLNYLLRLVNFIGADVDVIELFTAGRFSYTDSGQSVVADKLSDINLIVGYGLGSIQAPDNAYLEILFFGGIIGLLNYIFILFVLVYFSIKGYYNHPVLARYLLSLTLFIAFASVGAPIFGINRSNYFIIIPLVITIRILSMQKKTK